MVSSQSPTFKSFPTSVIYVRWVNRYYLLGDDKVDINISMYEISIGASPDSSLNPHQAMFFGVLEYGIRFKIFRVSRISFVCFDPTDVFTTTIAPLLQALHIC